MTSRRVVAVALLAALIAAGLYALLGPRPETPQPKTPRTSDSEGTHRVRVVDPDGEPLAGARVEMHRRSEYRTESELLGSGVTGPDGTVGLPEPPEGEGDLVYLVRGEKIAPEVTTLDPLDSTLYLSPSTEASGLVLDLRGAPVAGARVVYPPRAPHAIETETDDRGRFSLGAVPDSAWVRAECEGFAPLELSLSLFPLEDRDFTFYLVRGRRIAGRVLDSSGKPVPGALVELDQEAVSRRTTDAGGRFEFDSALTDWEAMLTARKEGYVGPTLSFAVGVRSADLPLFRPGEIRGRILDGLTGDPCSVARFRRLDATIGEDGRFTAPNLLPGDYTFQVRADWRVAEVDIDVREGEVRTGVIISVNAPRWGPARDYRAAYPVALHFVDEVTKEPAEGVRVRGQRPGQETRCDARGDLVLRLPPGEHRLVVGGPLARHAMKEITVAVPETTERTVPVRANVAGRLVLTGGSARSGSKAWLRAGGEVVEYRLNGTELEFTADPTLPLDAYVKAKEYRTAVVRDHDFSAGDRIEVPLERGVEIRGRCLGSGGHPLGKVVAEVQEHPLDARRETLGDGVFHLGGLEPGKYLLLLYARNVRTQRIDLDLGPEGIDLGDVQMLPPCDVVVRVLTSSGEPVAGAMVETSILVSAKARTDGAGMVLLPGTNEEEMLRVEAPGFLVAWTEIRVPPELERLEKLVTLLKPAGLLLRVVDRSGLPLVPLVPEGATAAGPGELHFTGLPPGPFEVEIEDRDGRTGTLRTSLREGEDRVETLVLE